MLNAVLFWFVVAVFGVGQALLVRSAWQLRQHPAPVPEGVPQSNGNANLFWTLVTAVLTFIVLYYTYLALV